MVVPEHPFLEYCAEIVEVVKYLVRSASVTAFSLCGCREGF